VLLSERSQGVDEQAPGFRAIASSPCGRGPAAACGRTAEVSVPLDLTPALSSLRQRASCDGAAVRIGFASEGRGADRVAGTGSASDLAGGR
jgi:hypothetical protein